MLPEFLIGKTIKSVETVEFHMGELTPFELNITFTDESSIKVWPSSDGENLGISLYSKETSESK